MTVRSRARLVGERMPGLDGGSAGEHALIVIGFDRTVSVDVDAVWRTLTTEAGLARWLGPCTKHPDGRVDVHLTSESGAPKVTARVVHALEGAQVTAEVLVPEQTRGLVTVMLDSDLSTDAPSTTISVIQGFEDAERLQVLGVLWDFYLERLARAAEGRDVDQVQLEPDYQPGLCRHFEDLIREAIQAGARPRISD